MTEELSFLDYLRQAHAGERRGNEELNRAIVPLLEQLVAAHDMERVGPLDGVARIFVDRGRLWFHAADVQPPRDARRRLRAVERTNAGGVEVVGSGEVVIDVGEGRASRYDQRQGQEEITRPVFVPAYSTWEQELGHHDALTDVFCAGMLLASLATGSDFTEPEELQAFVRGRHRLTRDHPGLHPVIARAIVRMTEPDRHRRAQDLRGLIDRLRGYRDVDERLDTDLDFESIEGFVSADRSSRRRIVQTHLQARLFDVSRRNRLIYFKSTLQMLDVTSASVPSQLAIDSIRPDELFLWDGAAGDALKAGKPIRLEKWIRFEDAPWARGTLDRVRSQDRRARTELGFSQLRLVLAFLNWHNLRESEDTRIRSPLLLLPVSLTLQRGVRDSYVLTPRDHLAEVNPVLRHHLAEVYGLELPDAVDLRKTDVATFHGALQASIQRSEPGVSLHLIRRPQIRVLRETARRRMDRWRRRSRVTGGGLRQTLGVQFSYSKRNFQPLGLTLYHQKVKPREVHLEEHLGGAKLVTPSPESAGAETNPPDVEVTERRVWSRDEAAGGPYDWAVDLTHLTLGNFNYRKMSIVRDYQRMLDEDDGHEHPSFDTLFSLDAKALGAPPEPADDALDLFTVVPADPTQAAAIRWARTGQSFIIQGPPGTGKSQTITNLIADFAAHGKRVLFVCQKRVALDVVYHRLSQHGLDELSVLIHDSQDDKKAFIADLGRTYTDWSAPGSVPSQESLRDSAIERLRTGVAHLERFAVGMTGPVAGGDISFGQALEVRLRLGAGPDLDLETRELLPSHAAWQRGRDAVHQASRTLAELGESPILAALPLRDLSAAILEAPRPVNALKDALAETARLVADVLDIAGRSETATTAQELTRALELAASVASLLPDNLGLLDPDSRRSEELDRLLDEYEAARAALESARAEAGHWTTKLSRGDTTTALARARSFDAMFVLFRWLTPAWWALRGVLRRSYDFARHAVKPTWTDVLGRLNLEYERASSVEEILASAKKRFGVNGALEAFERQVRELRGRTHTAEERALLTRWTREPAAARTVLEARASIERLSTAAAHVFDAGDRMSFDVLAQRVRAATDAADLLPTVAGALRQIHEAEPEVRRAARRLPLTPNELDAAVTASAVDRTLANNRPLARFGEAALRSTQIELRQASHSLEELNARVIRERVRRRFAAHLNVSRLPKSELSDEERTLKSVYTAGRRVLEREFEKVMRHRSIRELSEGDTGAVVYDLKPIWLMSPLSISDTIPLDDIRFDVVIFDEASQIPLEEAVPAVYRAPQMIVVGDEMQLPPTSFFSAGRTAPDDRDGTDDTVAEVHYDLEAESFLSHCARRLPSTMLGWHYRSRHEALIRFSNEAFYDGELNTVPDRRRAAERDPIVVSGPEQGAEQVSAVLDRPLSFHRLEASPYVKRTNLGEATYIAHLVRGLIRGGAGLTLGIVAFSEAQQGTIEAELDRLAAADHVFRRELDAEYEREDDGQLVGLFVKNLENVQGDERDIIILSVCYGPDAHGKMRMNFGPINKGGGEKRLNVVFSRAKRHMAVVSSIEHHQITNLYNDGAMCLRRYLRYAEAASCGDDVTADQVMASLRRAERDSAVATSSSVVVEELAAALEDEGLVVTRHLGTSDFRVDLGVGRDDEDAMRVAVLVDTPSFYEGYDPLEAHHTRPSVLRAFGWAVVPVLCKEWLAERAAVISRVLRAVEDPSAFALPEPEDPPPEPSIDETTASESGTDLARLEIAGATIVFTGQLSGWSRAEVETLVRELGGRPAKALSTRTTFVVFGARPGSTLQRAQQRGLPIVDEATFSGLVASAKS